MKVSIIIPNHNGEHLLKNNLPGIVKAAQSGEIIVVDDGSTDKSAEFVKHNYPEIKIIQTGHNRGYAYAVNMGVTKSSGEIVVLLNTDIKPAVNFLKPLLSHFSDKQVFAVGCLDRSYENNQVILRGRGIAKWKRGFYEHSRGEVNRTDTAWVSGGSGAFCKSIWLKLGGMDEIFSPFYWEDIDLSYRARKAGFKVLFDPKSIVDHYHEQGRIKSGFSPGFIKRISYRNQILFAWKNITDSNLLVIHFLWWPYHFMRALINFDLSFILGFFTALLKIRTIHRYRKYKQLDWIKNDPDL